jgi:hypothetical protein
VHRGGHRTLTEFSDSRPQATYAELAGELGNDVAVVQAETLLRAEALRDGHFGRFARASLARLLREYLPYGWHVGERFDFQEARSFASWVSTLGVEHESEAREAWRALRESVRPPTGWKPSGSDDPLLTTALATLSG